MYNADYIEIEYSLKCQMFVSDLQAIMMSIVPSYWQANSKQEMHRVPVASALRLDYRSDANLAFAIILSHLEPCILTPYTESPSLKETIIRVCWQLSQMIRPII